MALTGKKYLGPILDASRNLHRDLFFAQHSARSLATSARMNDDASRAAALRAGAGHAKKALLEADLSATAAGIAGNCGVAGFGAGPAAVLAGGEGADVYFSSLAEECVLKFQSQVGAGVLALLHPAAAASTTAAEYVVHSEQIAENIVQVLERKALEACTCGTDALMSEAVVARALVAIHQDAVSLGGLFELYLRLGTTGIAVRMVLHRQFAIGALDLLLAGGSAYSQNLVVIAFCLCSQSHGPLLRNLFFLLVGIARHTNHRRSQQTALQRVPALKLLQNLVVGR